jgi:hypothetical protein
VLRTSKAAGSVPLVTAQVTILFPASLAAEIAQDALLTGNRTFI